MKRLAMLLVAAAAAGCSARAKTPTATPPAPEVRFTDVTREAGLDFIQHHGGCGKAYFVEQTGAGVAMLDVENDGDLDLYFPQPTWLPGCAQRAPLQSRLYLNDGTGRFRQAPGAAGAVTREYAIGVAAADYDADGFTDLFVSCWGRSRLFRNRGGKRFQDVTDAAGLVCPGYSTSCAWLDYDGDGRLDLFVTGYVQWEPTTDVQCPAPDGKLDYCTPQAFAPGTNRLFRNVGQGRFQDVTRQAGLGTLHDRALGTVALDFDADGRQDLFVANDGGANMLFCNKGGGRFENEAMLRAVAYGASGKPQANMGLAPGDYDRDGDPDLLVTTFADEPFTLYRNEGTFFKDVSAPAGLAEPTYIPLGFGTRFLDVDQDGLLDVFFANGHVERHIAQRSSTQKFKQANQLFLGTPEGRFREASSALPADDVRVHRGAAAGDLDGDGDLDLVVTALDDRPTLLRNDSSTGNWLTVDVRTKGGAPGAIGARVRITAAGQSQSGWVVGGGSYISQSEYGVHFGLGGGTVVDSLEVTWPDGKKVSHANVPANQRLVVRRP